jgi:hypothetical protein
LKGKLSEKSLADEVTVEYLNVLNSWKACMFNIQYLLHATNISKC